MQLHTCVRALSASFFSLFGTGRSAAGNPRGASGVQLHSGGVGILGGAALYLLQTMSLRILDGATMKRRALYGLVRRD